MRFYVLILVIALLSLISGPTRGQQVGLRAASGALKTEGALDENTMWDALLGILDAHGEAMSYGDVDRFLLGKFACKAEYDTASVGADGRDKGVRLRATRSLCRGGEVIHYSGPEHEGSKATQYKLELYWFPSKTRCFRASVALTSLVKRGWKTQDFSREAPSGTPLPNEVGPGTQTLKSPIGDEFLSVSWVPKENPSQLYSVDPSQGCLLSAQVSH